MHCNTSTVHLRQLFFCVPKIAAVVGDSPADVHPLRCRKKLVHPVASRRQLAAEDRLLINAALPSEG
jgi:hypothetical protein